MKVLLVDDDEVVRQSLTKALVHLKHQVFSAGTIAEAKTSIIQHHPEIALLDLHLREGSGSEIMETLLEHCPATPIIFITADPDHQVFQQATMKKSVYSVVEKPVSLKRLRTVLQWAGENRVVASQGKKLEALVDLPHEDELKTYVKYWGYKKILVFLFAVLLLLGLINHFYYNVQIMPNLESMGVPVERYMEKINEYMKRGEERELRMKKTKDSW